MTDAFLATVVSRNSVKKTVKVKPLITEVDGTAHPEITCKALQGLKPTVDDIVLVITIRNNLDDKKISRYFEASEANGRIIAIVKSDDSDVLFTLILDQEELAFKVNPVNQKLDIIQRSTQRTAFSDGFMTAFGPTVSRIPNGNPV